MAGWECAKKSKGVHMFKMRRREFITLLGGAAGWPVAARAQQAMPVVGFLHSGSPDGFPDLVRGFRQGLKDAGYIEGENVAIDYRWADNQMHRLPELAAELTRRKVTVITAPTHVAAAAAKAVTATIPIVFLSADDPVRLGFVASLARPGNNMTGINFLNAELSAKRLDFLHTLVPRAARVAVLVNPANAATTEGTLRDLEPAGLAMTLKIRLLKASTREEIDAAFATFAGERPDAVFVGVDPFFTSRRVQLVHLATRYALPAAYAGRQFAEIGGLMSYGTNFSDSYRQVGIYTGRILKGTKPAELPVLQSSKFELVINAQSARMLGLTVPDKLLSIADEVIE
jgi:putative tryptophan/tyrosine transport system substrate-binding protein